MTKVFLDANVLYSSTVRSLFIWLHVNRVVEIYWSAEAWEEAFTAYARDHEESIAARFRKSMTENAIAIYPHCMIKVPAYQPVGLKDPNDEHVVAAAKAGEVDYLVTNDVTLLGEDLNQLDLLSTKPDDLLMALVKSSSKSLIQSVRDHISNLPKSKPSLDIYIQSLRKAGLVQFGSWLEKKKTTNKLFPEVW